MMKGIIWKTIKLTLMLSLLVYGVVYAQGDDTSRATVLSVEGFVDVLYAGTDKIVTLDEGSSLGPGDIIQTGDEGKVIIELPDKSKLVIGESSRIVVTELGMIEVTRTTTSTFELVKGKIRAIVNPFVSRESTFTIKTINATVGVRGTDFGEFFDPDLNQTYILGLEDCVSVTPTGYPGGVPIIVCGGSEITLTGSGAPPAPTGASGSTINQFLEEMGITGEGGTGTGEIEPPYITGIFINRVINLEDLDGLLTLTKDDLSIDGKIVITGGAIDEAYRVTSVEVSIDGGMTWNIADGTTVWMYGFVPQEGIEYQVMARATNEMGVVSDPRELGDWMIAFENTDYESIARAIINKFFSYVMTSDSSIIDIISDNYDGVINQIYSKSELVDLLTNPLNQGITINYTIDQINSTGNMIIVSTRWSATISGYKNEGTTKFWLAKDDNFNIAHMEGKWFSFSISPPELTLEIVNSVDLSPCDKAVRVLLTAPNIPSSVMTVTAHSFTYCELPPSGHDMYLSRAFYTDITGNTDGFGGDYVIEDTLGCTSSGCSIMPFIYNSMMDPTRTMTVTFTGYGYNFIQVITLP